jgi:hypothetical protein
MSARRWLNCAPVERQHSHPVQSAPWRKLRFLGQHVALQVIPKVMCHYDQDRKWPRSESPMHFAHADGPTLSWKRVSKFSGPNASMSPDLWPVVLMGTEELHTYLVSSKYLSPAANLRDLRHCPSGQLSRSLRETGCAIDCVDITSCEDGIYFG